MKQQFCLINDNVKRNVVNFIQSLPVDHRSPLIIEAREESRTDKQNRLMWPLLKDLSDQVIWHGEKLEPAEWKDLITVLVSQMQNPEREQKSAPGINGGRVYFGVRTSQSSKRYMVEVVEAIYWFGTEHNVKFSEKSSSRIAWAQEWRASHAQSAR
ncbi:TPA: recombination protein NinB [Klebsiella pneumoniae]|nr:recombination protein NinB [Klebsiella pneumoniae]